MKGGQRDPCNSFAVMDYGALVVPVAGMGEKCTSSKHAEEREDGLADISCAGDPPFTEARSPRRVFFSSRGLFLMQMSSLRRIYKRVRGTYLFSAISTSFFFSFSFVFPINFSRFTSANVDNGSRVVDKIKCCNYQ